MGKTTSLHSLNNDKGLTRINKVKWFVYNYFNNRMPLTYLDPDLSLELFSFSKLIINRKSRSSPSRRLCDIFWNSLQWEKLANSLGYSVKALEVGCGSGIYGKLIDGHLRNYLTNYTGIDIKSKSDWNELSQNPKFNFFLDNSNSLFEKLIGKNLIFTQSAIEHFDEDLTFFKQIVKYINGTKQPIIQIHLMPSAPCLTKYLWHGVRQYTPRTISKITRLFDNNTKKLLFPLGGKSCNKVHRKYITYSTRFRMVDKRYLETDQYNNDLKEAIMKDQSSNNVNGPSFYALVMISNLSESLNIL